MPALDLDALISPELVRHVAQALCEAFAWGDDQKPHLSQDESEEMARAAIKAMIKPFDALIRIAAMQAALIASAQHGHCGCSRIGVDELAWCYEARIRDFIAAPHPDTLSPAEKERRAMASWGVTI